MPSTGTVVAAVLFVDYDDAPAQRSVDQVFSLVSPGAGEFFEAVSYGRLRLDLRPHPAWLRLSQPSDFYGAGLSTFEGHRGFIQEAVSLADDAVDFGTADLVVVLSNPDAPGVGYGPAFGSPDPAQGIQADGVFIPSAVTSGADLPGWGPLWLNHEMGHTMTLPDLYAYDNDGSGIDEHRFVGSFGLMGLISGRAPEPFAFERWMLGWLDDSQVVCQTEGELTTTLDAVEAPGGTKAVVVPTGATTAVVIESRRAVGYDTALSEPGALVYTVDTSTPSGAGPIVVPQTVEGDEWKDSAPLSVGESLTVDGVTVSVVEAGPQGDTVLVSVSA